jgi:hypothetical protein
MCKNIIVGKEYLQIYRIENRYLHYAPVHRHTFLQKRIMYKYRYRFLQVYTGTSLQILGVYKILDHICAYTFCLYGAVRNGFEAGKIFYKGHWKGWVLEIETLLGPEVATSEASVIWAQKSREQFRNQQRHISYCIIYASGT